MKPCPEYREAVALLAARALGGTAKENTERHLDSCRECRAQFEKIRAICGPFEGMPREVSSAGLPAGFHRRLVERVRADATAPAASPTFLEWLRAWFSWPRVSSAAVVAMALLAALFWILPDRSFHDPRVKLTGGFPVVASPPPPTLMALSRALQESENALDSLLARQERLLAANDPPIAALANAGNTVW